MIFFTLCGLGWILWWMMEKDMAKNGRSGGNINTKCGGDGEHMIVAHTGLHRRRER
jgi:hypothetical protein